MPSGYTRKSVGHVLSHPEPAREYYVFVARYWPRFYDLRIDDPDCVFDAWDRELAPSPGLLRAYDEDEPWSDWATRYVEEVGDATIRRRAAEHAAAAGDRTVVFVCYESEDERPRCHTWTVLDVLADQRQTSLADFCTTDGGDPAHERDRDANAETCPHGTEWCLGPESETLPCFACFDQGHESDGGA